MRVLMRATVTVEGFPAALAERGAEVAGVPDDLVQDDPRYRTVTLGRLTLDEALERLPGWTLRPEAGGPGKRLWERMHRTVKARVREHNRVAAGLGVDRED